MANLAWELQKAIFGVLNGAGFQAAIGQTVPVLDRIPSKTKPPYIKIGDDDIRGDLASGYDGSQTTVTIGVWSLGPGMQLVKTIADQVRVFLCPLQPGAAPFAITGHRLVTWTFDGARFADDVDGLSVKAVVVLTFETYPTA